jgi:anti-sigma B factor antagonist
MQAHEHIADGIPVIQIEGDIDLAVSPELRHLLAEHAKARSPALVLDCTGVRYVDSSGLATLIEYVRNAQDFGGKFALAGVSNRVRTVIELVRLHEFLPIHLSVADAVAALLAK